MGHWSKIGAIDPDFDQFWGVGNVKCALFGGFLTFSGIWPKSALFQPVSQKIGVLGIKFEPKTSKSGIFTMETLENTFCTLLSDVPCNSVAPPVF